VEQIQGECGADEALAGLTANSTPAHRSLFSFRSVFTVYGRTQLPAPAQRAY
jgi:hypothetical protein